MITTDELRAITEPTTDVLGALIEQMSRTDMEGSTWRARADRRELSLYRSIVDTASLNSELGYRLAYMRDNPDALLSVTATGVAFTDLQHEVLFKIGKPA